MLPRRSFLKFGATASLAAVSGVSARLAAADKPALPAFPPVAFVVVGDTHYFADKDDPASLNPASRTTTSALIEQLNRLPGSAFPAAIGGGKVLPLSQVIHVGDIIDSGDKNGAVISKMQATEWKEWQADYGLDGKDGRLKFPAYEIHGNHDGPHGKGLVLDGIIARNKQRKDLKAISTNGLHYAWVVNGVHFINLGITVGRVKAVTRKRRYDPMDSLEFLVDYLAKHVGTSGAPVLISHHVDFARYALPVADDIVLKNEWDYADVQAFHDALKPYRIAGIFYGHTHVRAVFAWRGPKPDPVVAGKPLPLGIPTFNTDNSAHFGGPTQAFLYVEVHAEDTLVRELATKDAWKTSAWTNLSWRLPHYTG